MNSRQVGQVNNLPHSGCPNVQTRAAGLQPAPTALAARPRGGEWLEDEIASWQRENVNSVFSLLTPGEEVDLDLANEAADAKANGMKFLAYPIPDAQVPIPYSISQKI